MENWTIERLATVIVVFMCGLFSLFGVAIAVAVFVLIHITSAHSMDDGRYANSALKPWFDSLKSKKGMCCSFADGLSIKDVDWDTKDNHYRVRLDGEWYDVPPDAVIEEPNKFGPAVVWPYKYGTEKWQIRCFIPGAET